MTGRCRSRRVSRAQLTDVTQRLSIIDETKLQLKRANFCQGQLCPMCNWWRSLCQSTLGAAIGSLHSPDEAVTLEAGGAALLARAR
jgi:hypothetical protein